LAILKIIYTFLTKFAISIGVHESVAFIVPICLGLLIFAMFIAFLKSLFKPTRKNSDSASNLVDGRTATDGRMAMRRFDRTEVNIKGSVASYTLEDSPTPQVCQILDVSLTGLGFSCRETLEKNARIKFSLPNYDSKDKEKVFYISGEIVRIKEINNKFYEYGISFFHVFKRESSLLQLMIEKFSS